MNKTAKLLITLTIFGILVTSVNAFSVTTAQQAGVDVGIISKDVAFTTPEQVVIVPIFPPTNEFNQTYSDWYKGMYYYLIGNTVRPGFTDLPFHYVVTESGQVFQGNQGKDERRIVLDGLSQNSVVVAYLAGRSEVEFDSRATDSLQQLILDICNRNAINPNKVKVSGVEFVRNAKEQTVSLKSANLFGLWKTAADSVVSKISAKYAPISKIYNIQLISTVGPTEAVKTESLVSYTVKIKNAGEFGIYGGTSSAIILTKKDGSKSLFYNADTWLTTTQVGLIAEGDSLLPGEEKDFQIQTKMPVDFGEKSEDFTVSTVAGGVIKDLVVKLSANISKPDGIIVQVKPTDTGFLRVRSSPSGAATEVSRISPGERYFQLEDAGNGWVKLKLGDGKEGWVSNQFLTYL